MSGQGSFVPTISIHALREEGDVGTAMFPPKLTLFLSTPSARRATRDARRSDPVRQISIHALREEGDGFTYKTAAFVWVFLSTPSARRATAVLQPLDQLIRISIHALREEGDLLQTRKGLYKGDFYPRPPRGGRPKLHA